MQGYPERTEPVRREEVRIYGYAIATLPLNACRRRKFYFQEAPYEPIPELFAPLIEELQKEREARLAAQQEREARLVAQNPALKELAESLRAAFHSLGIGRNSPSTELHMPHAAGRYPRQCRHCKRPFFNAARVHGSCCSDACMAARTRRKKIERLTRTRRCARQGRKCEHCGVPIEAARSTKRFCSDICRVRAHRASAAP